MKPRSRLLVAAVTAATVLFMSAAALADSTSDAGYPGGSPGQKSMMNDMPYSKILRMPADQRMGAAMKARKLHTLLMGGVSTKQHISKEVSLTGEISDLTCWSSLGYHGINHSMCAKICTLSGSPVAFLEEDGNGSVLRAYVVQSAADAVPLPAELYDYVSTAKPVQVTGYVDDRAGVPALTIASIDGRQLSYSMPMARNYVWGY